MTDRDIFKLYTPEHKDYARAQYALNNNLSLLDFDEWSFINRILERDIPFQDMHLMNKCIREYNQCFGTDYGWDWLSYPEDENTRELFENMIEFAHKWEVGNKEYNIVDYHGVCCSIRAYSAKIALKKYRNLLTSTGVYSLCKEQGEWHLISSYGGDWTARLKESKSDKRK